MYAKKTKICKQFKNRKTLYGHLPPKNIVELKPYNSVHVDLIGPYSKSIRQQQTGRAIIRNNVSLTCMKTIDPSSGYIWDLLVFCYHEIMVIYPYPFLVVINQFFSWIIFIPDCICILTGSPE